MPRQRPSLTSTQRLTLVLLLLANVGVLSALALLALSGGWFTADAWAALPTSAPAALPSSDTASSSIPTHLPDIALTTTAIPSATPGNTSTATPAPLSGAQTTATPFSTLPPALELAPAPSLPPQALIPDITGHPQTLALSCEARSAVDWAAYFGVPIDEIEFLNSLPTSDDPDEGFVGDVHSAWGQIPPEAYGVHAMPVAERLKHYGLKARARRSLAWDEVRVEIAAGQPVIAWVVGHVERGGDRVLYTASNGRTSYVARYEHTVIVIGYTEDTVTVLDGGQVYARSLEVFLASWFPLGNMAVLYVGP